MKILNLFLYLNFIAIYQVFAQGSVKVKASADIVQELAVEVKYQFPQFRKGQIIYLSGQQSSAQFNYNILLNEMHYIDRKGDTLALDQEHLIRHITIDGKTFYYDQQRGYQELIEDYKSLKLTRHQQLKIVNREKMSAYGQTSSTSAIQTFNTISGDNTYYKLSSNDVLTLRKEINYYLIDNNNRIFAASKSNIVKLFSRHKKEIEKYLQDSKIDLNREESLHQLLQYCSQLI